MPTYEDPGCFCKMCCPICAVAQAKGVGACPDMLLAIGCGCFYTMFCWNPEEKPAGEAVEQSQMDR